MLLTKLQKQVNFSSFVTNTPVKVSKNYMVITVRFVLKKIFEKLLAYNFKNPLGNAHL